MAAALGDKEKKNSVVENMNIASSNLVKYGTWENLTTLAGFSVADAEVLKTEGWNDLDLLSTLVECVIIDNPSNFLAALKSALPTTLTFNGCVRLVAAMKKDPTTQNAPDL